MQMTGHDKDIYVREGIHDRQRNRAVRNRVKSKCTHVHKTAYTRGSKSLRPLVKMRIFLFSVNTNCSLQIILT